MKNIHILPTDKPSRLYLHSDNELQLRTNIIRTSEDYLGSNQHIYITSDEEIKEGDWMYYKHFGEDIVTKYNTWGGLNTNVNEHKDYYKKIILTTDQDLIKDGVQAIDDEFLEWFVKNPSCENVKVELIEEIPSGFTFGMFGNDEPPTELVYKIIIPQEEPKQETPEEAAKSKYGIGYGAVDSINAFIEGTKWQAETMYSEEEVFNLCREFAIFVQRNGPSYKKQQEWFEQFKKK